MTHASSSALPRWTVRSVASTMALDSIGRLQPGKNHCSSSSARVRVPKISRSDVSTVVSSAVNESRNETNLPIVKVSVKLYAVLSACRQMSVCAVSVQGVRRAPRHARGLGGIPEIGDAMDDSGWLGRSCTGRSG